MARVQKLWKNHGFFSVRSSPRNRQEHVDLSRERPGGCNGTWGYHGAMSG